MDGKGAPERNYTSSTCPVKHVGSWTRNTPTARTLPSDLRSEGIQRKATMLLSSQQLQEEKKPLQVQGTASLPSNSSEFTHLIS